MAYKKKCPRCGEYSYSASGEGSWRCATCKADISDVELEPAVEKSNEEN